MHVSGLSAALPSPIAGVGAGTIAISPTTTTVQHLPLTQFTRYVTSGIHAGPRLRYRAVEPPASRPARSPSLAPGAWQAAAARSRANAADYQQYLRSQRQWIDLDNADPREFSAARILQKVCRHRQLQNASHAALFARLKNDNDEAIDEAALIAFDVHESARTIANGMSMSEIRARFASALIQEWHEAAIGYRLLPSAPFAPAHAKYWYDGNTIRNAHGKSTDNVVDDLFSGAVAAESVAMQTLIDHANQARQLAGQPTNARTADWPALSIAIGGIPAAVPVYPQRPDTVAIGDVWLTYEELYTIFHAALRILMLDPYYPIGTPLHSVATTLLRLGPGHSVTCTTPHEPASMMHAFNQLANAWNQHSQFPFSPRLYAAHHLAKSSGVLFLNTTSTRTPCEQMTDQVGADLAPLVAAQSRQPDSAFRNDTVATIRLGTRSNIDALADAPETLCYADAADLNRQLHDYLHQRLLALTEMPGYDENFMIESHLQETLSLTALQLRTKRGVNFYINDFMGGGLLKPSVQLTPLEEFRRRIADSKPAMTFNGHTIDTEDALAEIRQSVARILVADRVVEAKAAELFRGRGVAVDARKLRASRELIAASLVPPVPGSRWWTVVDLLDDVNMGPMIRGILQTLKSGDPKEILGLLPFIIPVVEMEEGLRLQNYQRAKKGLIRFGIDVAFTAAGIGLEKMLARGAIGAAAATIAREQLALTERAGLDAMHSMSGLFRELPGSEWAGHSVVEEGRFNLPPDAADLSIPAPLSATKSLTAAKTRWSHEVTQQSLYLIDEQRSVSVRAIDGGFYELDQRGHLIADAPIIFGDALTGRGYRVTSHVGMQGGIAVVPAKVLFARSTVSDVLRFWKTIVASPQLAIRRSTPRDILKMLFVPAAEPIETHTALDLFVNIWRKAYTRYQSFAQFEDFWLNVYRQSDTAAAIMNQAYDKRVYRGVGEVSFNQERAFVSGNDLCFLSDKKLKALHYVSNMGETLFQQQRMYLHEGLHWLTRLADPEIAEAHMHRGPIVYLTDRILTEVGDSPSTPARIAYKTPPRFSSNELAHRAWAADLDVLHDWSVAEDRLLDKHLDAGRQYPDAMMVMGQKIADRVTVRQGMALREIFDGHVPFGARDTGPLYQRIAHAFALPNARYDALLHRLIVKSSTFREIAAAWRARPRLRRVAVALADFNMKAEIFSEGVWSYQISGKSMRLNTRQLYYFSETGVIPLDEMRQFSGALLDYFLSEMMLPERALLMGNGYSERGIVVALEDEVMAQLGDKGAQRICEQLSANDRGILRYQTSVRRAADSENGYLHRKTHQDLPPGAAREIPDILALTRDPIAAAVVDTRS
jgi:hypothetical protein